VTPIATPPARASNTTSGYNPALAVLDNSPWSAWVTAYAPAQTGAWLYVDLGASRALARVQWFITTGEFAADYDVELSNDGLAWTLHPDGEALRAPNGQSWTTLDRAVVARYIRFSFRNHTRTIAPRLGSLGTVQVFAPG
jgi:hypothetical protein